MARGIHAHFKGQYSLSASLGTFALTGNAATLTYTQGSPAQQITTFTVSSTTITQGNSVTVTWATTNATNVRLNGSLVAASGFQSFAPLSNTSYTLTADGAVPTISAGPLNVTVITSSGGSLPLTQTAFNVNLGNVPWSRKPDGEAYDADHKIYAYSGFTYSAKHDAVFFFGGGHACSPFDSMYRLPIAATLAWQRDFQEIPLSKLQQINGVPVASPLPAGTPLNSDGSGMYDYMGYTASTVSGLPANKWWKRAEAGMAAPAWSPIARHTYANLRYSSATGTIFCCLASNGSPYKVAIGAGGNWWEYDPDTLTFTDLGFVNAASDYYAACEDPVSGKFILLASRGFLVYDPRNKFVAPRVVTSSGLSALAQFCVMAYYPPEDSFIYLAAVYPSNSTDVPYTFQFKLDRDGSQTGKVMGPIWSGPNPAVATPMTTNWRPRGLSYYMFCYDADSQMIVGGQTQYAAVSTATNPASIYGLKPVFSNNTGTWFNQSVAPQNALLSHTAAYVPSVRCHILGAGTSSPGDTWATRLDPAAWAQNIDLRPLKSSITTTADGVTYNTLQDAVNVGGDITIGSGTLVGADGAATINLPVNITATGATIDGALSLNGLGAGQGALVTFADTTINGLTLIATPGTTSGVGAIRLQAGDLTLTNCTISDAPDGILAGGSGPAEISTVSLSGCTISYCGTSDGQAHYLYIHKIAQFLANNVTCTSGTRGKGNMFKSKSKVSNIVSCTAGTDLTGTESYEFDFEQGGNVTIDTCTALKGPNADNPVVLNYGRADDVRWYPGDDRCYVRNCTIENRSAVGTQATGLRNTYPNPRPDGGPGVTCYADGVTFKGQYVSVAGVRQYFTGKWKYRNCKFVADDGTITTLADTWAAGDPLPAPDAAPPPFISDVASTLRSDGNYNLQFRVRYATANASQTGITLNGAAVPYAANAPTDANGTITQTVIDSLGFIRTVPVPAGTYVLVAHGPTAPDATTTLTVP